MSSISLRRHVLRKLAFHLDGSNNNIVNASQSVLSRILVSLSPRMMIHLHTKHKDGFTTLMHCGAKNWCLDVIHGDKMS